LVIYGFCLVLCIFLCFLCFLFFFFFQAEDGIRDWSVTGVQTCALPIYLGQDRFYVWIEDHALRSRHKNGPGPSGGTSRAHAVSRSEERRVGKECRYRGARYN